MASFPQAFVSRLSSSLGADTAPRVLAALGETPSVSIRLNPAKLLDFPGIPVPWSPFGRILPDRPSFTLDPLFHAGAYYVQDSSAMVVGEIFRRTLPEVDRPLRVLDLCAAPGGKTTDIASSLRGRPALTVANEVMKDRATVLRENIAIWGEPGVVVTSVDPAAFASLGGFFDVIVADVPCSGEGMFRKDEGAVRGWSEDGVRLCASRSRRIVADVWPALAEGGILIWSTCTFSPEENDDNVLWIAETLGAEVITPKVELPGPVATGCGILMLPGYVPGEGQYVAALRKTSSAPAPKSLRRPKVDSSLKSFAGYLHEGFEVVAREGRLYAMPSAISAEIDALNPLRPLLSGIALGELKGRDFVPSADLALSTAFRREVFPAVDLSREDALRFLRRDAVSAGDAPRGYVTATYNDVPIGFLKQLGTRTNNLHPARRRIRMDIQQ